METTSTASREGGVFLSRHAQYGEHWGEGIARCFSLEADILDEDHAVRLMPVPDNFLCPISAAIMVDPVATVDGCVYERQYIERWFRERRQAGYRISSPITGLELPSATLMPLVALQRAIEVYLAHRPELKREHMAGRSFEEAAQILQTDLFEKQQVHATIQDKLKRLKCANKELLRALQEAHLHIGHLERQRSIGAVGAGGGGGGSEGATPSSCSTSHPVCQGRPEALPPLSECCEHSELSPRKTGTFAALGPPLCFSRGRVVVAVILLACLATAIAALCQYHHHHHRGVWPGHRSWRTSGSSSGSGSGSPGGLGVAAATHTSPPLPPSVMNLQHFGGGLPSSEGVSDIPILLEHLLAGSVEERRRAVFALRAFVTEHPEQQVVVTEAGAITPLILMLREETPSLREEAARALWSLVRTHKEVNLSNQKAIADAGAIAPLVHLLSDEASRVRVVAAAVLNDLATDNSANQVAVARAGAINPLIALLKDEEAPALVMAAGLLKSLAASNGVPHDAAVVLALGDAVAPLVALLQADTLLAQEQAASTLGAFAAYSPEMQASIARAGAIPPLVERLRGDMMQGTAALALRNLAANSHNNQNAIVQAGAIPALVKLLEDGMPGVREEAARALWKLASRNRDHQAIVLETGAAVPLVALLEGSDHAEASLALLNIARLE